MFGGTAIDRLNVLIVGIDGIGKSDLGESIVNTARNRNVELDVVISNKLPLNESKPSPSQIENDPTSSQDVGMGRVDFVVFMVDMKSRLSLERCYESIVKLDMEHIAFARAMLVVLSSETPSKFAFPKQEITHFATTHGFHINYCTIDDQESINSTGQNIVTSAIDTKRGHGVSPLFKSGLEMEYLPNA